MINTLIIALGTILSSIFYRLGGTGGEWYKSSWIRDWICTFILLAVMQWTNIWHWSLYISIPLMIGALSTYHKWLNPLMDQPTTDCLWFNWLAHGIGIGLAILPYGYFTHTIDKVLYRALILGLSMMVWSVLVDWDKLEEGGRGGLIILTLLIVKGLK